jgi:hypothetical protein
MVRTPHAELSPLCCVQGMASTRVRLYRPSGSLDRRRLARVPRMIEKSRCFFITSLHIAINAHHLYHITVGGS